MSHARPIPVSLRRSLFLHVALPVLQAWARETGGAFPRSRHLLTGQGLKLLRNPDVIFDLPDRGASQRQTVNGQTQLIFEAVLQVQL